MPRRTDRMKTNEDYFKLLGKALEKMDETQAQEWKVLTEGIREDTGIKGKAVDLTKLNPEQLSEDHPVRDFLEHWESTPIR